MCREASFHIKHILSSETLIFFPFECNISRSLDSEANTKSEQNNDSRKKGSGYYEKCIALRHSNGELWNWNYIEREPIDRV